MLHGFIFAFKMIKKRPMRMCLTLLQVGAGVAAIAIVLSFVFSLMADTDEGESVIFTVQAGMERVMNGGIQRSIMSAFTDEIVEAFREESHYLDSISVFVSNYQGMVQYDGMSYMYNELLGVSPGYTQIVNLSMLEGSFFTQADIDSDNKVLVISKEANEELFGKESGVGKVINMGRDADIQNATEGWKIIGIYSREDQPNAYQIFPHFIAPYTLVTYRPPQMADESQEIREFKPTYHSLLVSVRSENVEEFKKEMQMIFSHEFNHEAVGNSGFDMEKADLMFQERTFIGAEQRQEVGKSFGLLMGSFAFVAVVVSSIGILSTMLVSVVERTREIGLRRSLGASRWNIVGQILAESMMLAFLGGLLGIVLAFIFIEPIINGLILKTIFQNLMGVSAVVSIYPILISMAGILFVGFVAGIYPGFQASRLMPVDALRES